MIDESPTLAVGNYSIELISEGFGVFNTDEFNNKERVAIVLDPEVGMRVVEGLILVDMKRFYHPEAAPVISSAEGKPLPPFLEKVASRSQDSL